MRLGFLTAPFPDTPLMDVADWAASAGFEVLELACWPRATGPTRRYAGTSHIDVANLSAGQAREIRAEIDSRLANPLIYARGDTEAVEKLQRKRAEVEDGLTRAEALWMAALERLEAAGAA